MTMLYHVETCTHHGPTRRRRWHCVHTSSSRADCYAYIDRAIADLPSDTDVRRSFSLTQERARTFYRVRGVRTAK